MSLVRLVESQLPLVVKVELGAQGSSAELNLFIGLAEVWVYSGLLIFQSVLFLVNVNTVMYLKCFFLKIDFNF